MHASILKLYNTKTKHIFSRIMASMSACDKFSAEKTTVSASSHGDSCTDNHFKYPIAMQLNTPEFRAIHTAQVQCLAKLFKANNYDLRIAGGAVRDLLMNNIPSDIDFATTATPVQMKAMFEKEGIRMINMNGERHGTITPRILDSVNFEVTTLRVDVATDGRHADVVFTTDWKIDAGRRDLTINSMFLDFDGFVYDYFNGYEDILARKIRFVGEADARIKEDYLRILRYFRFFATISNDGAFEEDIIAAVKCNSDGLARISGERIWMELKKTIQKRNFTKSIFQQLFDCGCFSYIGLPKNFNEDEFYKTLSTLKHQTKYEPILIMASLIQTKDEAVSLHQRLKLSAFERDLMYFIVENRHREYSLQELQKLSILNASILVHEFIKHLLQYQNKSEIKESFINWIKPRFPLDGNKLREMNLRGDNMGLVMTKLKIMWIESEFCLTEHELCNLTPTVIKDLGIDLNKDVKRKKIKK